ncbi:MAG: PQQ-binding-like beta-propeller repeat protein [Alphaproteobacteria bacterium]|nr:PQQ-binding-like beta-propeller repeat protein [Alphaproteobacteria bacterium]
MILALLAALALAASPVGWRGDGSGRFPDATPPAQWSRTAGLLWQTDLASWSNAAPIATGGLVCTLTEPSTVTCMDAGTGAVRWQGTNEVVDTLPEAQAAGLRGKLGRAEALEEEHRELQRSYSEARRAARGGGDVVAELERIAARMTELRSVLNELAPYRTAQADRVIGWSSPTPVTDGTHLWAVFSTGVVSCWTLDGKKVWSRWLGASKGALKGYDGVPTASPRLVAGTLVVGFDTLRGLDPATGLDRWTAGPYADFGTPEVTVLDGRPLVLTPDGRVLDARDGRVLLEGLGDLWYSGPVVQGDRAYWGGTTSDEGRPPAWPTAVKAWRLRTQGDGLAADPLWTVQLPVRHRFYSTPLADGDRLVLVSRERHLVVLDTADGSLVGQRELEVDVPAEVWASPQRVGPDWMVMTDQGHVLRLDRATLATKTVSRLERGLGNPLFVGGRVYVRGREHLFAVGR